MVRARVAGDERTECARDDDWDGVRERRAGVPWEAASNAVSAADDGDSNTCMSEERLMLESDVANGAVLGAARGGEAAAAARACACVRDVRRGRVAAADVCDVTAADVAAVSSA